MNIKQSILLAVPFSFFVMDFASAHLTINADQKQTSDLIVEQGHSQSWSVPKLTQNYSGYPFEKCACDNPKIAQVTVHRNGMTVKGIASGTTNLDCTYGDSETTVYKTWTIKVISPSHTIDKAFHNYGPS